MTIDTARHDDIIGTMTSNTNETQILEYNNQYVYSDILPESFLSRYTKFQPQWGYNGLGYIVYKRTYARKITDNTTEEWWQTVGRCINGAQKIGTQYTPDEAQRLYDLIFNLKCNFGGRMLWQLGTSTVDRFGLASLLNCWYVSMRDVDDFCFVFEHLMLGGGVGYSVKREDIHELPRIKKNVNIRHDNVKDADFIVPDSRQGWVELLRKTLNSFFVSGKSFTYSTILIRGAGEQIKGFGGTASGPQILIDGLQKIFGVMKGREGKKLRSIDVLDINNIIGSIVVAGNVRRSAEVAIGDPDDYLYLRAKNWADGNVPNWRAMSNNSIYADTFHQISPEVWSNGYILDKKTGFAKGEPYGFMNLPLSKKFGRTGEERVDNCEGGNPCMEITLADGEACNLCELYLNNIESEDELNECARLLYKTQKAIWTLPAIYEKTEKVVKKNMRIGLGVTGICQSFDKLEWLDRCYVNLRDYDKQWSEFRGWPESIKLTTIKPSGTLSLLGGSTPGVHPAYARHYIRRVRMSSSDPLIKLCKDAGYRTEYVLNFDGTEDYSTIIVEFPCDSGETAVQAKDMSAVKQLNLVKSLQKLWADNSISVTVYYRPEELEEIQKWMEENYENGCKTLSFLLHSAHGFKQAPYEEIDEKTFQRLCKKIKPLETITNVSNDVLDGLECEGGACPIR